MRTKNKLGVLYLLFTFLWVTVGCDKDEDTMLSTVKVIESFTILESKGVINESSKTIDLTIKKGDLKTLKPIIKISDKATITPGSGEVTDFTEPVIYKVMAEDGTMTEYTITVKVEISDDMSGEFEPNERLGDIKEILTGKRADRWTIEKFVINRTETVTEKYEDDRIVFSLLNEDNTVIIAQKVTFNNLGSSIFNSELLTSNKDDDKTFLEQGKDGFLNFNLNLATLDISTGKLTFYNDFSRRSYKIVKGTTSNKIELRTPDNETILVLKKFEDFDNCSLSGDFVNFKEAETIKNIMDSGSDNPWFIKEFKIGTLDVTTKYENANFIFFKEGRAGFVHSKEDNRRIAQGIRSFLNDNDNNLRLLMGFYADGKTYLDLEDRFYKVVIDADTNQIELRSCTWVDNKPVVILFEKVK